MEFNLEEELAKLPNKPGVYIMHDKKDAIIYIGKAISLRHRVRQYFQASHHEGIKKDRMVQQIDRFEYIVTDSELEALVLECNLIKEHRPKYNTMLTDDKTYPYIKVTLGEMFPRVLFSRQLKKDRSVYFGPYTSAGAVKDTIGLIHKLYQIRTCNRNLPKDIGAERACLNYHIHQCQAPCQGYVSKEDYRKQIDGVLDFLNGRYQPVLRMLQEKMDAASEELDFEKAIEYRDLLNSVKQIAQKQKITHADGEDRDILALACDDRDAVVQIFFIRDGKMIGRDHFYLRIVNEDTPSQILSAFIKQFYAGTPYIPRELMLQTDIEDREVIEEWLGKKKGQRVYLRVPKRGSKEKLVELAEKNAMIVLTQDREKIKREEGRTIGAVKELADLLSLPREKVQRLEAYDISNTNGFESVGSMVVYDKGKPSRSDYRKFKLRTVAGPDDYASMQEVVRRRYGRMKEEGTPLPDLIITDGGKGQMDVVREVVEDELHLQIPIAGLAKDDRHRTNELLYGFPPQVIGLKTDSELFRVLTQIQDEVHRFAITFHRDKRSKHALHSELDDIKGIGSKTAEALLKAFKSVKSIKGATLEQLATAIGPAKAQLVYNHFQEGQQGEEA